jgi:threonine dehydrogenase-like Zn-dependent dehydrogenase
MRAVTFQAPGKVLVDDVPEPQLLDSTDAIVRIEATGVCGSDLHIYHGRVQIEPGFTIGHEYVGTVIAVGEDVQSVRVGERVLGSAAAASFTSATPRAPSAMAPCSARCRARRPSRRSCPAPTSSCGAFPRG